MTDKLAFEVSSEFLGKFSTAELLSEEQLDSLREALRAIGESVEKQVSTSLAPALIEFSKSIEASGLTNIEPAGLSGAIEALASVSDMSRRHVRQDE